MLQSIAKKNICSIWIFVIGLILNINFVNAQTSHNDESISSPKNRLKFGNYLFADKDYLRAIDEFRAYLKVEDYDTIRFKFSECFYRIGRYSEAAENYKSLFFHSQLSDEARLGYAKSLFFQKDFNNFRDYASTKEYLSSKYEKEIIRLEMISHFFDNSYLPDTNKFFAQFEDSNRTDVRKFYFMKKYPARKKPATAALLSSVIPGLGKIYTGEIGDGITSFITTSLLAYLSINNFNHDHKFRGWLFAGMTTFSYAGNIYGSAASAQIYNAGIKFNFDKDVKLYFERRNYFLPSEDWLE